LAKTDLQVDCLQQSQERSRRFKALKALHRHDDARFDAHVRYMNSVADGVIAERKKGGPDAKRNDLLQKMLDGRDTITKEGLSDENIRYQMLTFLIAG
jgi:cytochrome P450 / NADPH-cytochrome P450 reductase